MPGISVCGESGGFWPQRRHSLTGGRVPSHNGAVRRTFGGEKPTTAAGHSSHRLEKAGPDDQIRAPGQNTRKKMFAVFKTGGKQYRAAADDVLEVARVAGEPGDIVEFGEVLLVGGDDVTLGNPSVAGATVAAEVLAQGRGPKIVAFKKRRRKNSRRKRGHRQEFTLVRITEILTDGKKANKAVRPRPAPSPAAEAAPAAAPAEAAPSADVGNSATSSARKAAITKAKEGGKIKKPAAKAKGSPPKGKKK